MPIPTPDQMTKLFVLFLTKGPNWSSESTPALDKLQVEHVEYQLSLRKAGKTLLVGPLIDNGEIRGITVFKAGTIEEVQILMNDDPGVKAGVFGIQIHPWMVEKEALG
jgi:uncharacterized protein YciI